jgi:hypothetical protein
MLDERMIAVSLLDVPIDCIALFEALPASTGR